MTALHPDDRADQRAIDQLADDGLDVAELERAAERADAPGIPLAGVTVAERIAILEAEARRQSEWDRLAPYRDETGWLDIDALEHDAGIGAASWRDHDYRPTARELEDQAIASLRRSRERRGDADLERQAKTSALLIVAFFAAIAAILAGAYLLGVR